MKTRVIQWATGPVGAAQLREIFADPDLELAGVFVYSPEAHTASVCGWAKLPIRTAGRR